MYSQLSSSVSPPAAAFQAPAARLAGAAEAAANAEIEHRAAFPPIAIGVCAFAAVLLAVLATLGGFTATPRAFGLFAMFSSFSGALFLIYRDIRKDQRIAYIFGALCIMVIATYINAVLALVGLANPFPLQDQPLLDLSAAIGFDYVAILEWIARRPPTGAILQFSYLSCGPMMFAAPIVLAWTRQYGRLRRFVTLYVLLVTLCVVISIFLPAEGYAVYAPLPAELARRLPQGAADFFAPIAQAFRSGAVRTLDPAYFQGVVEFPSFHTDAALLTIYAFWRTPVLWVLALAMNVMVLLSVIPIGGHYVWDVVAAALLFVAVLPLARRWDQQSAKSSQ